MFTDIYYMSSGCRKREAHNNWSMVIPEKAAPVTQTTSRLLPCADGLWAVSVGAQLRDPINTGLTRWRSAVHMDAVAESGRNPVSKPPIQPECGERTG